MRCAHLLLIGLVCCASCAAAPAGRWQIVIGADGIRRQIFVPSACGPAGSSPVDPADVRPELPPVPVPTRPLVPIGDLPQAPAAQSGPSDQSDPKRERPEPEILRVETPTPLTVEPVGPGFTAIAESLAAIASHDPGRDNATPPIGATCPLPAAKQEASPARDVASDAIYWALTAAAGAAGVGVPGIGVWAAWKAAKLLLGRARSRATEQTAAVTGSHQGPAEPICTISWHGEQLRENRLRISDLERQLAETKPVVVRDEAAPAPQKVIRNREFVEIEKPSARLAAIQKAMDLYVQKYPGGRTFVETIEAFADQIESGSKE